MYAMYYNMAWALLLIITKRISISCGGKSYEKSDHYFLYVGMFLHPERFGCNGYHNNRKRRLGQTRRIQ